MEILEEDMEAHPRVRDLAAVCKEFLVMGEYIGFVVQDMHSKYGMNNYLLLNQWNRWISEIQRGSWAEDARLHFDRKKREMVG